MDILQLVEPSSSSRARAGAVSAPERVTRMGLPATEALRPEPALVIAHDFAAVGAVLQVGRNWRLDHLPDLAG